MTTEQSLWLRRWQALDNTIDLLEERYKSFTLESSSRRENTLFTLIVQLREFAAGQFHFFHDGFYKKQFVDLAPIPDTRTFTFPQYITRHSIEAHVLHNTLRQIAEDTIVIQRASEQRMMAQLAAEAGVMGRENILSALEDVDKLALAALQMVDKYLKDPQQTEDKHPKQTALTYFRRSADVRVIPYAPVVMIGIPVTAVGLHRGMGVAEDLLAIPHEVAHHLYWNGRAKSGQRIPVELLARITNNLASHWLEEIFADVVGCLIGGPAVARSFIDLQLTSIGADFVHIHDPHPTPALRPLLYAYALEKMGFVNSATAVRGVWQQHLDARMTFVNRALLFAAFKIVDAVLDVIDKNNLSPWLRWSSDEVEYEMLYEHFAGRIQGLVQSVSDADLDPEDMNIQTSWLDLAMELSAQPQLQNLPAGWTNPENMGGVAGFNPIPLEAAAWLRIYDFGGWITAGPGPKQVGG